MPRRDKVPDTEPGRGTQAGESPARGPNKPRRVGRHGKDTTGFPGRDEAARPEDAGTVARSEDFGGRRDIETADEPVEEHDRRHHES
jgi:hypothetical protein